MLRIKKYGAGNSIFFMHWTNLQIRKLTLTSLVNVMMFLMLHVKFRQCIVSKDHIFMNNGDNFIKFTGLLINTP